MRNDKRRAHFGRDRTGQRWCPTDHLAARTGRTYLGQPVCGRCGRDEWGFLWPNCVDLARFADGWPIQPAIRRAVHELSCARYWADGNDDWACDDCEAEMAREEET